MRLLQETKQIMNQYHITANKNYGQNFLIDETIVEEIIEHAAISKEDFVIEIGPGLGTLTSRLLEKAGKVTCIEIDKNMISILNNRFSMYPHFELIQNDILKENLHTLINKNLQNVSLKKAKIVANLPYYITTPIIMKLLEDKLPLCSITVMVQQEVAERLVENPGGKATGSITYCIHYYTNPKIVLTVPNTSFIPSPKINSAVIKLDILPSPKINVKNEAFLFKIIKCAFMQKRKTLLNALSKATLEEMLNHLHIDTNIRGEKLTLEAFGKISDYLS